MKIACLQLDSIVGGFDRNIAKLKHSYHRAVQAGAELAITPELFLSGYFARDLVMQQDFVQDCNEALIRVAEFVEEVPLVIGTLHQDESGVLFNGGVVIKNKQILACSTKVCLPTYDIFDQDRYFKKGSNCVFEHKGKKIAVTICEDLLNNWFLAEKPVDAVLAQGADILLNLSASPWNFGKEKLRLSMLSSIAKEHGVAIAHANLVGCMDELIFDGQSLIFNPQGDLVGLGNAFEEDMVLADTSSSEVQHVDWPASEAQLFYALALGVREHLQKRGHERILLDLTPTVSSLVTLAMAVEAVQPDQLDIVIRSENSALKQVLETLEIEPHTTLTEQHPERRLLELSLLARQRKALLLCSSNKTELAVEPMPTNHGHDSLALLGDVLRGQVLEVAQWINRKMEILPASIIDEEMQTFQTSQADLVDKIIDRYVVQRESLDRMADESLEPEVIRSWVKKIHLQEARRRQTPPVLKISRRAFGMGRHFPLMLGLE